MNTNPLPESPFSSRDNSCFSTDPNVATLNVIADNEESFQLSYAQFLYSRLAPNPALEKEPDVPPQRLMICFAVAEVVVLGSGLKTIDRAIQKHELKFIQRADRRYTDTLKTHVAAVSVTFTKENV
ncbi:MAG: hypothetical protein WBN22_06730 [Verrucomicrobiia bacterium]